MLFRSIQVEANDAKDTTSRDQIRQHLSEIAKMFAQGNFTDPMMVHDETPAGVPALKNLKSKIKYSFEQTNGGGRVLITTTDHDAVSAVHEFLRYQIKEHATGDSGKVEPSRKP